MEPIGLVGFGLMGQGIATCLLSRGMSVRVYDSDRRTYKRGQTNIDAALERAYTQLACERAGVEVEAFKKKVAGQLRTKP